MEPYKNKEPIFGIILTLPIARFVLHLPPDLLNIFHEIDDGIITGASETCIEISANEEW